MRRRGDAADLEETEAESEGAVERAGALVEAGGEADGVGKIQAPERVAQTRMPVRSYPGTETVGEGPECKIMGRLRRQAPQQ